MNRVKKGSAVSCTWSCGNQTRLCSPMRAFLQLRATLGLEHRGRAASLQVARNACIALQPSSASHSIPLPERQRLAWQGDATCPGSSRVSTHQMTAGGATGRKIGGAAGRTMGGATGRTMGGAAGREASGLETDAMRPRFAAKLASRWPRQCNGFRRAHPSQMI